ncbi:site-specific DNA-methyltransferase [Staphylococcus hominis]|uniref:site-specific DNA-methyltransferase n=1 Tax=Staphylococcus hominis TaxID=1290 RepID=UPI0022E37232|nr:site-specific DNA-methyltransferase [Staphylococcus hominis]
MNSNPRKINLSNYNSRKIDINLLNELHELFTASEDQKERYDFTWNGKAKAYFEAAIPTTKTLHVQQDESINFENTNNMFITGDNLETLKLLQESYLHKIDMIYIDPPYNTGKDFVYNDNFRKTKKEFELENGSIDEDNSRLIKNEKSSGHYHSDWLTMMYPRLKLARNLLSDNGVIFLSIDDNELANLKLLMDSIFGEDNFITNMVWENKEGGGKSDSKYFRNKHEYIIVYAKNINNAIINGVAVENVDRYKLKDQYINSRGPYYLQKLGMGSIQYSKKLDYPIEAPDNSLIYPSDNNSGKKAIWRWSKEKLLWGQKNGYVEIKKDKKGIWTVYTKQYLNADNDGNIITRTNQPLAVIDKFSTTQANKNLSKIFDGHNLFSYSKPVDLISYLIEIGSSKDSIILDFFAGSGTTAQSVMEVNKKHNTNRKFIVNTLDENVNNKTDELIQTYNTIDKLARERIRRASYNLGDTSGFRALKVDKSGLREDIFKTSNDLIQEDLLSDIDNQSDNRSNYDLLYDVLIDSALEFNKKIEHESINEEDIIKYDYSSEMTGVIAYFDNNLTDKLIQKIAKFKPLIAVFKESTFNKSAQKVNVLEQFRIISPDTKVKVI